MSISFRQIPSRLRVPGVFIEQTAKLESSGERLNTVLHLGYADGGSAEEDTMYRIGSVADARNLFGNHSMLVGMAERHLTINKGLLLYAAAVKPPAQHVAAQSTISITSAATDDSLLLVRIADLPVSCAVAEGDTAAQIAAKLTAAINAEPACLVTAEVAGDVIELTSKLPGALGNDIPVVIGYNTEEVPLVGVEVEPMSGGSGVPNLQPVLDNMGENFYDYIATPFTDTASLQASDAVVEQRWHAMAGFNVQTLLMYTIADSHAATVTKGKTQNSEFLIPYSSGYTPQAPWIWTVSRLAVEADLLTNDPAAPMTATPIPGLKAPKECWGWQQRNELLYSGMSTFTQDQAGNVYIEKTITSYQKDPQGFEDASYLEIHVPELMRNLRRVQSAYLASKYRGYKLTDHLEQHASGSKITSPDNIRAALIGFYINNLVLARAWCTDNEHYKDTIRIERDTDNRKRVNYYDEPVMIGQLEIIAGQSELQHG